jgi:hypothetical protein
LREIAVFGGRAHPALAAEICADLGVRCGKSGQQRRRLAMLPVAASNSANPSTRVTFIEVLRCLARRFCSGAARYSALDRCGRDQGGAGQRQVGPVPQIAVP